MTGLPRTNDPHCFLETEKPIAMNATFELTTLEEAGGILIEYQLKGPTHASMTCLNIQTVE